MRISWVRHNPVALILTSHIAICPQIFSMPFKERGFYKKVVLNHLNSIIEPIQSRIRICVYFLLRETIIKNLIRPNEINILNPHTHPP